MQPGDSVYATGFHLKINNGDNVAGPTVGQLSINYQKLSLTGTIIYNGSGVPVDTTLSYTTTIQTLGIPPLVLCGPLCGNRLDTNGTFETPIVNCTNFNTFFNNIAPNYICQAVGTLSAGRFAITNNAINQNAAWSSAGDATNFMAIDGSTALANTTVWSSNVNVVMGVSYCFSTLVRNLWPAGDARGGILPNIDMRVNGIPLPSGASGPIAGASGWVTNTASWTATTNGTVTISIVLTTVGNPGNDLGLDDVSFRAIGSPPVITASANPSLFCGITPPPLVTLTGNGPANTTYAWTGRALNANSGATVTASPLASANYTVTGTLPNGCFNTASVRVNIGSNPVVTLTTNPTNAEICPGGSATICATAPTANLFPGDIAIIRNFRPGGGGINQLSFVSLVDLPAGTRINFTNRGWDNTTSGFAGFGATFTYISPGITAGTIVTITPNFTLNPSDQILAYQGAINPSFIYGLSTTTWITAGTPNNNTSYLPPALINGLTAVSLNLATGNVFYNVPLTAGNANAILTSIGTAANWAAGSGATPAFNLTGAIHAGFAWAGGTFIANGQCTPGTNTSSITVSAAGTYTVTYTDIHGCSTTVNQTIKKRGLTPDWATYFGGIGFVDRSWAVVTDENNDIYVSGYTVGSTPGLPVTSGPPTNVSTIGPIGQNDIYVSKITADGNHVVWTLYIGGSGGDKFPVMYYDKGSVYVAGLTRTQDFAAPRAVYQGGVTGGGDDAYCFKLDAKTGNLDWCSVLACTANDGFEGVSVSGSTVYLGGTVNGTGLLPGATNTPFGDDDIFITLLNANNGTVIQSTYFGGPGQDCSFGMANDASGNAYLVGFSNNFIDASLTARETVISGNPNPVYGEFDAVLIRHTPAGVMTNWVKVGGTQNENFDGVRVNSATGDVFATGWSASNTNNPADFNGAAFNRVGNTVYGGADYLLCKFSTTTLIPELTRFYGGTNDDYGVDVELDKSGDVYVVGKAGSPDVFALNPPPVPYYRNYTNTLPNRSALLARFDPNTFALNWETYYGNDPAKGSGLPGETLGDDMSIDTQDKIVFCGYTDSPTFEWVASPIQPALRQTIGGGFVVKMSCNLSVNCPTCRDAVASQSILQDSVSGINTLKVFPNPFTNEVNIKFTGNENSRYSIKIINSLGNEVFFKDNLLADEPISLGEELQNGLYIVQVIGDGKIHTARIVKVK
jgi:Secretion system C-terminal sorting domain